MLNYNLLALKIGGCIRVGLIAATVTRLAQATILLMGQTTHMALAIGALVRIIVATLSENSRIAALARRTRCIAKRASMAVSPVLLYSQKAYLNQSAGCFFFFVMAQLAAVISGVAGLANDDTTCTCCACSKKTARHMAQCR